MRSSLDRTSMETDDPVRRNIRPSAEHRGAPDAALWRNPTFWLFVAFVVLMAGSLSYLWGAVSAWLAVALGAVGRYVGFTVMHESSHRVAHRNRRMNEALGWPPALALSTSLPLFRTVHNKHHGSTNQPGLDPDLGVARNPRLLRPLWLLSPLWEYRTHYFGKGWAKQRRHRWMQIGIDVTFVAIIVAAVGTGNAAPLFVVLVAPTLIAVGVLGFAFDFLPHAPYDSTERFHDTRSLPSRTLNVLFLGQNYHLVHHLWSTVPWYKYQRVHVETRDDLEAIGARVTWGKRRPDNRSAPSRI